MYWADLVDGEEIHSSYVDSEGQTPRSLATATLSNVLAGHNGIVAAMEIVAALAAGVVGVALGAWLARRNEKRAATERLLVEAVSDVVDGIARVAQGSPDAQALYAAALARVALHGSPEIVRAFSYHQEEATTLTPEGRHRLVAAMQQARLELGRQRLEERDLELMLFGAQPESAKQAGS